MSCTKFRRQIDLQLERELPPERVRALDLHLKDCSACRAYKAREARLDLLLRNQPRSEFPAWLHHQILDQASQHDRKRLFIKHRRKLQLIPALVALSLSLILGGIIGKYSYNSLKPFPQSVAAVEQEEPSAPALASFGETSLLDNGYNTGAINE